MFTSLHVCGKYREDTERKKGAWGLQAARNQAANKYWNMAQIILFERNAKKTITLLLTKHILMDICMFYLKWIHVFQILLNCIIYNYHHASQNCHVSQMKNYLPYLFLISSSENVMSVLAIKFMKKKKKKEEETGQRALESSQSSSSSFSCFSLEGEEIISQKEIILC